MSTSATVGWLNVSALALRGAQAFGESSTRSEVAKTLSYETRRRSGREGRQLLSRLTYAALRR